MGGNVSVSGVCVCGISPVQSKPPGKQQIKMNEASLFSFLLKDREENSRFQPW